MPAAVSSGSAPRCASLALAAALALAAIPASAAETIGAVGRIAGPATGAVAGSAHPLAAGEQVFQDEVIETGDGGRVEIRLADGTAVTLGERASMTLDTFVYEPAGASRLHATIDGAFRYISGPLAKGASRDASVGTPIATIGVRGTDFWGGAIDGSFGVVVLEGEVTVTANGVSRTLRARGEGVQTAAGAAPGPVVNWAAAKIQRALATVTFP